MKIYSRLGETPDDQIFLEHRALTLAEEIFDRLRDCPHVTATEADRYRDVELPPGLENDGRSVSVVLPVFNEATTLPLTLVRLANLPLRLELVVVDDCSTDGTRDLLRRLDGLDNVRVILRDQNEGKGRALRTGFQQCTGDFVIVQDADLEYDPIDIPRVLSPLFNNDADVVYGSRFLDSQNKQGWVWGHRAGNMVLTRLSNLFTGFQLTDMETCYKAFRRELIQSIPLEQERFGIEPEMTAKLARRRPALTEVAISYRGRSYAEGKKIGVRGLFSALYCIVRYGIRD